MNTNTFINI